MRNTIYICAFLMSTLSVRAQLREVAHNNDLWFLQLTRVQLTQRVGFEHETHLRLAEWGGTMQQFLLRPSLYYQLNESVRFNLGYSHIETYPYGEQPVARQTPENNYWAQVTLDHKAGSLLVSHRYRLEERWVGLISANSSTGDVDSYEHRNRFRYRVTVRKDLTNHPMYFSAFNEAWVNFGDHTALNRFDQNWLYVGTGRKITDKLSLEGGYMWQVIMKADGQHVESNNNIQFSAFYIIKKKNN